jgi:putative flippase GtrA
MRQPVLFILVGGFQYMLDAVLFGILISVGIGTIPSNITSRATAAVTGFLLNRYLTFGKRNDNAKLFSSSLIRFLVFFAVMTILSTGLIMLLERWVGDNDTQRIFYKIGVEAVLAIISFFISRNWVFRT